MRIKFICLALVALLEGMLLGSNLYAVSYNIKPNQLLPTELLEELPSSFFVTGITCHMPNYSCAELEYLFSCTPPVMCSRQQIIKGLERLRLQSPTIDISFGLEKVHDGYEVCVEGVQEWTVGRITYRGMSFAQDEYGLLYDSTPGELFSQERHKASLELIQKASQDKGYLDTSVEDHLTYHQDTKIVDITIKILQKNKYKIRVIDVVCVDGLATLSFQEKKSLYKKFFSRFIKKAYDTKVLEECFKEVRNYLSGLGCIDTTLRVDEVINKETSSVDIVITLGCSERRDMKFFGNHFFSEEQLRAVIMQFGNEAGILPPSVMSQEIQDSYRKKGFWHIDIKTHQDQHVDYFIIHEGPRAIVKEISIQGVNIHEQKHLVDTFFKKSIKGKAFDEATMQAALYQMIAWYKEGGYLDATMLKQEWHHLEKSYHYQAMLMFDKGPCYSLQTIQCLHEPQELTEKFQLLLPTCPATLSLSKLRTIKKTMVELLQKAGYPQASVTLEKKLTGTSYDVIYDVDTGPLLKVGHILIQGSTKTRHDVIRSLVTTKTGGPWSKEQLQNSFSLMKATNVFERIGLQPVFSTSYGDERDVLVTLQDEEPFEVKARLGFEQLSKNFAFKKGSSYTAGGTFVWKNPTGQVDSVLFDLDMSRFERKVILAYKTPFFLSIPLNSTIKGYSNKYTQPVAIGSIDTLYNVTQEGFLCGLSKHFTHCDLGMTTGFEWMMINNISDRLSRAINFKTTLIGKHVPYFFAEPMIYIDYVDNRLCATKGTFAALTIKMMLPLKSEATYFVKCIIENGWFVPLFECVWATRIRIGHIFKQTFNTIMPPERFYLGGSNSLRGYQVDKCPPLGTYVDDQSEVRWIQQGGKTMLNFNTELRFPLFYKPVQGVVFQDFGILVERPQDLLVIPDKPLAATGFGLRYETPIGPLRFDIGWKWYRDHPDDPMYAWFLTFNHMF